MHRRAFLAGTAAVALTTLAGRAHAASSRVRQISRDERGITVFMELEHAPFPAPGAAYADPTVIVFVPHYLRVSRTERLSALVHFHGHNSTAERAIVAHELREQLFDSKQNAILVVPQGPVMAADSACGKLAAPGGLARMLTDVLAVLDRIATMPTPGPTAIRAGTRIDTVCLSAHSGGYHAAASCLKNGGVAVNEVYLFDALYGDTDAFRDWVIAGKGRTMRTRHKLVSYYGPGATESESQKLLVELERHGVDCVWERAEGLLSREEITRSDAVFIRTQVAHGDVTHELNALRDCLYASGMTRHLRTAWFDHKEGARPLERRR